MRVWKGQNNFSFEGFLAQHHNEFVSMQQCAEHLEYQLPNEHTRVSYLLEGIQCLDAGLQAAMESVHMDDGPTGMRNNFEAAIAHLLPYDPVANNRSTTGNKQQPTQIYLVETEGEPAAEISGMNAGGKRTAKPSISKTGVYLCYHMPDEYYALSNEQKDELREWRKANPSKLESKTKSDCKAKQAAQHQISLAVAKAIKKLAKLVLPVQDQQISLDAQVASMVQNVLSQEVDPKPAAKETTIHSIIKSVKNP